MILKIQWTPWEEPPHGTRKRAGKRVAARAARTGREGGAFDGFQGLCLLCAQPGHRAADCKTGLVCLRCGEAGHMTRACSLPRPPRLRSPEHHGNELARKRPHSEDHVRSDSRDDGDHHVRARDGRVMRGREGEAHRALRVHERRDVQPCREDVPSRGVPLDVVRSSRDALSRRPGLLVSALSWDLRRHAGSCTSRTLRARSRRCHARLRPMTASSCRCCS